MYDLTIIGAGWAGFNAAQEAKTLGLKVALVEQSALGGTCLNRGCIPTKTLIQSAKILEQSKKSKLFGVSCCSESVICQADLAEIQKRKEKIVQDLRRGMEVQLSGIDYFNAPARIIDKNTLGLGDKQIQTKSLLIATGSEPIELEVLKFKAQNILSSDEILNLKQVPEMLLIVGGGVIGCEFASLFSVLGSQVTIVELMVQLLPGEDKEIARKLENSFKKRGIKVNTNTDVQSVDLKDFALVLVCVGRKPKIDALGPLNLKTEKNKIIVDEFLRTSVPGVYAAGDCTGKTMLAHYAAYQGKIAAYNIAHPDALKKADNRIIPNCIFSFPEIASVGLNEEAAKASGFEIKIHKFDFLGSGMARILEESEGLIKVVSQAKSGEILGAAIIGPRATELIAIFTLAIQAGLKIYQIRETIFAHPTLGESIAETFK